MKRREFISLLGGAAAAWPLAARAQQPAMPVIGFLSSASPNLYSDRLRTFREGLKEAGYVEGRNVEIDYRWAEAHNDRLPVLAAELVHRQVAVIVAAGGTPSALAAKVATTAIPIVFGVAVDPVEVGLVESLNRPGGNLTGVTNLTLELGPKKLELLHEVVPTATTIGLLLNPANPNSEIASKDMRAAASTLGVELDVRRASTEREIDEVFASLVQARVGALVINPDSLFTSRMEQLVALTARYAMPSRIRRGRRPRRLWSQPYGRLSSGRRIHGSGSGRREACRPAGATIHKSGTGHQSEDGQDARHHIPDLAACARR